MIVGIARQLKVPILEISKGITQEQADQISELIIQECDVEFLKYFKNLKKLKIKNDSRDMGRTIDLDISNMEKLELLDIISTYGIKNINVENVPNLHSVNISGNKKLEKTSGLEKQKGLEELLMLDNKSLKDIPDIQLIAHMKNIKKLHVDINFLHFLEKKYGNIDNLNRDKIMKKNVILIERMGIFANRLEFDKGIELEKKSKEILSNIIDDSMNETEKICAINTWFVENVKYDYKAVEERDAAVAGKIELEGQEAADNIRANSAYNSLVLKSAVCEGYTNGMEYLLNKAGIETKKVDCRYKNEEEKETTEYILDPKRMNHSIIRFKTEEGWFYSDPTFDSMIPYKRKFFFKTKKEISKFHSLSKVEENIDSPEVRPDKYSNEEILRIITAQSKRKQKQISKKDINDSDENPEMRNSIEENPNSWKNSIVFEIFPEENRQQMVNVFEQDESKDSENRDEQIEDYEVE